jgi:hypothetical protein
MSCDRGCACKVTAIFQRMFRIHSTDLSVIQVLLRFVYSFFVNSTAQKFRDES